jgi:hypothetical protein
MNQKDFVNTFYRYAEQSGAALGVNPKFILAQWGLETGWTQNYAHNLAGIGAFDNPATRQTPYGFLYPDYQKFASAYVSLIQKNYKHAIGAQTMTAFATGLKLGGWATDANYVPVLVRTYNSISGLTPEPTTGVLAVDTGAGTGADTGIKWGSYQGIGIGVVAILGACLMAGVLVFSGSNSGGGGGSNE